MSRMLLLSHAEVSKAAYDALTLIVGNNSDKISYITLPYGQDLDLYQKAIEAEIQKAKGEGILILTDLFAQDYMDNIIKKFQLKSLQA